LLAKLAGYGSDRQQAISRLVRALNEYFVGGIKTNVALFRRILKDAAFAVGNIDTGYLDRLLESPAPEANRGDAAIAAIAAGVFAVLDGQVGGAVNGRQTHANEGTSSDWKKAARAAAIRGSES